MSFVIIEKNDNSVPSDTDIRTAMSDSGGTVMTVTGDNASKRVDFTGDVDHTDFENALIRVARGRRTSWNFAWGDADIYGNGAGALRASRYEIDIDMPLATVTALINGNYNLYGFKAVQTDLGGGAPLVWFQLPKTAYSRDTQLLWSVQYQAYTSTSSIIPDGVVRASFSTAINFGETLEVVPGGFGDVKKRGDPRALSIHNTTTTPFTCGISQHAADGTSNPLCAFPLYGQGLDVFVPIEKVLLLFSTQPVNTGTVIHQAYSPGVLVDLTGASRRTVAYDINTGWSWGGYTWASGVAANQNLVPLLIEPGGSAVAVPQEGRSLVSG